MQVTEVKVFPVSEEKLRAFVSVVFDQCFMVNDIKIIQGREGLFISMPSRRKKNGRFKDVAHPLNNETRKMIEARVLARYEQVMRGETEEPQAGDRVDAAASPDPEPQAADREKEQEPEDRSLEEVAEMHLRDSFWTT